MAQNEHAPIVYWIDRKMEITAVAGPWDQFARENDGADMASSSVLGRSIWAFVTGDPARMWVEALFQLATVTGRMVERPYRCDSPDLKRFMRMRVIPEGAGVLRVEHELLRTEKQQRAVIIRPVGNLRASGLMRCSVCGRINKGESWREPDLCDVPSATEPVLRVMYTVCQQCFLLLPAG